MARRKVTAENLGSVISDIMKDYHEGVIESVKEVTAQVTKAGVQAVRNSSLETFSAM